MNEQIKVSCYQNIYKEIKAIPEVEGLGYPEKRENYDFYFSIGSMQVTYSLKRKSDLLSIRASSSIPEHISDDAARQFCKDLLVDSIYRGYADNRTMTISYSVPVIGVSDNVAAEITHKSAVDFISFLCDKKADIERFFMKKEAIKEVMQCDEEEAISVDKKKDAVEMQVEEDTESAPTSTSFVEKEKIEVENIKSDSETKEPIMMDTSAELNKEVKKKEASGKKEETYHSTDDVLNKAETNTSDTVAEDSSGEKQEEENTLVRKRITFEQFCHTQMQDIERRMKNAKELENHLDERFALLTERLQELESLEKQLRLQAEKNEQKNKELEEREILTSELDNKENQITILQDAIQAREDEIRRNSLFAALSGQKKTPSMDTEKEKEYEATINKLNAENHDLKVQVNRLSEVKDSIEGSLFLQREKNEKINRSFQQLQDKLLQMEGELMKEQNSMKLGIDISLLEEAGYMTKENVGEKEDLFVINSPTIPKDIKMTSDTKHGVALFQKTLRRGKKYGQTVWSWNQESFCSAYILNGNEILVKKQLSSNIDEDIEDVLDKLKILK